MGDKVSLPGEGRRGVGEVSYRRHANECNIKDKLSGRERKFQNELTDERLLIYRKREENIRDVY